MFHDVASRVKARCDVVLCTTTGGAPGQTPPERLGVVSALSPELASCNMGSMNFALFPLAERYKEYKLEWEKPFLERTDRAYLHQHLRRDEILSSRRCRSRRPARSWRFTTSA